MTTEQGLCLERAQTLPAAVAGRAPVQSTADVKWRRLAPTRSLTDAYRLQAGSSTAGFPMHPTPSLAPNYPWADRWCPKGLHPGLHPRPLHRLRRLRSWCGPGLRPYIGAPTVSAAGATGAQRGNHAREEAAQRAQEAYQAAIGRAANAWQVPFNPADYLRAPRVDVRVHRQDENALNWHRAMQAPCGHVERENAINQMLLPPRP